MLCCIGKIELDKERIEDAILQAVALASREGIEIKEIKISLSQYEILTDSNVNKAVEINYVDYPIRVYA